jgi:hypothetical protein
MKSVPLRSRPRFPIKWFKDPLLDLRLFNLADRLLLNYTGGSWGYIEGDGFGFMQPPGDKVQLCNPFSAEEQDIDARLAGIILTIYAVGMACERGYQLADLHGRLMTAAYDYAESVGMTNQAFQLLD